MRRILPAISVFLLCVFSLSPAYAEQGRDKAEALFKEAVAVFERGDRAKAVEIMREAVKADASYHEAFDRLGHMLLQMRRFDDSIEAFQAALKTKPGLRTAKTGIGLALVGKGAEKEAEAVLTEALAMNPYPSMTHYALGLLYERRGDYEKAIHHYREGIRTFKEGKK